VPNYGNRIVAQRLRRAGFRGEIAEHGELFDVTQRMRRGDGLDFVLGQHALALRDVEGRKVFSETLLARGGDVAQAATQRRPSFGRKTIVGLCENKTSDRDRTRTRRSSRRRDDRVTDEREQRFVSDIPAGRRGERGPCARGQTGPKRGSPSNERGVAQGFTTVHRLPFFNSATACCAARAASAINVSEGFCVPVEVMQAPSVTKTFAQVWS